MSLSEVLNKPSQAQYAATAVSSALIQVVAREVLASRHNTLVSYRAIEQASTIRNHISALIRYAEKSNDVGKAWKAYQRYTKAVHSLEV